jgi:hypothetical protein
MANWIVQHQESASDRLVITSYIGSTPASTDLGMLLRRVISEIQDYWKVYHYYCAHKTYDIYVIICTFLHSLHNGFPFFIRKQFFCLFLLLAFT